MNSDWQVLKCCVYNHITAYKKEGQDHLSGDYQLKKGCFSRFLNALFKMCFYWVFFACLFV